MKINTLNQTQPMTTDTPPDFVPLCKKCGNPGLYIRTRYFDTQLAHVWACQNDKCKGFSYYWHTDHPNPNPVKLQAV